MMKVKDKEFLEAIKKCSSFKELKELLGYSNSSLLICRCKKLGADTSHFTPPKILMSEGAKKLTHSIDKVFVYGKRYTPKVKSRFIEKIEYRCSNCNNIGTHLGGETGT